MKKLPKGFRAFRDAAREVIGVESERAAAYHDRKNKGKVPLEMDVRLHRATDALMLAYEKLPASLRLS